MGICKFCGQKIYVKSKPIDLSALSDGEQRELHRTRSHPEYDYCTVETGRKTEENEYPVGQGSGWILNPKLRWQRLDYTEETYWMRRKVSDNKNLIGPDFIYTGPEYDKDWS